MKPFVRVSVKQHLKEVLKEVYKRDIKEGSCTRSKKMRTQDLGENLSPNPIQDMVASLPKKVCGTSPHIKLRLRLRLPLVVALARFACVAQNKPRPRARRACAHHPYKSDLIAKVKA